jgi:tetratricopeptide (TPR) repeat protein
MNLLRIALSHSRILTASICLSVAILVASLIVLTIRSHSSPLQDAERALESGQLKDAEAILIPLAIADEPRAITLLAKLSLRQNQPDFVIGMLETRLASRKDPEWFSLLGEAYLSLGRDQESWGAVREALDLHPVDVETLGRCAELTYRSGHPAPALELYSRLESLEPKKARWPRSRGRILMEIDQYELSSEAFRLASSLDTTDIDLRFELVEADFLRGELELSLSNIDRCLDTRPGDGRFAAARGEILHALGRRDEAVRTIEGLLAREPRSPRALRLRATWYLEARDPLPAVEMLERVLEIDPKDWRARYQLAVALEKLGRNPESKIHADRAKSDQDGFVTRN